MVIPKLDQVGDIWYIVCEFRIYLGFVDVVDETLGINKY